MTNRKLFGIFLVALLLILTGCQPKQTKPNFLLVMADDLGWGDVGFNGNPEAITPNLDRLASSGLIFSRFYSASPVCSPTRASCLTGRNPYRMGITTANKGHLPKHETTLAELLKEEGYSSGLFGKWHLGTLTDQISDANRGRPGDRTHLSVPTDHGFDLFFCTESKVPTFDPMKKPRSFHTDRGESLRYGWKPRADSQSQHYGTHYWTGLNQLADADLSGDDSEIIVTQALNFIADQVRNELPFFAVVWTHTPHLPVVADSDSRSISGKSDFQEQLYYGTILKLDEQIGRLWDEIVDLGIADETCLFFCSDNGPERGTPGSAANFRGRKRHLYEGGVRVPAFVIWPESISSQQRTDFPAFTSDYLPTIMNMLGSDDHLSLELDGMSIWPAITGNLTDREKPMGFRYPGRFSWVTHEYKLVSYDLGKSYELFNLLDDQEEQNNLIEKRQDIADQMKTDLQTWLDDVDQDRKSADKNTP